MFGESGGMFYYNFFFWGGGGGEGKNFNYPEVISD